MPRSPVLSAFLWLLAALVAQPAAAQEQAGPFSDWAGVFIAADYRASTGAPSEVFDNGRRAMARAFEGAGLKKENILQFSVRPARDTATNPLPAVPASIDQGMRELTAKATGGCLFFLTSHGTRDGVVLGELLLRPASLRNLLNATCGERPTVVMISACFSGVFVPELTAPNRIVMTAARADRTSFGCGEDDEYTFFDQCVLQSLPKVGDFEALAKEAAACVERREREMDVGPPSEPQVSIGVRMKLLLPLLRLDGARAPPG